MQDNCKISVNGKTLTITVDLSKKGSLSETGKNFTLGSTRGIEMIAAGDSLLKINCTVFRPNPEYKKDKSSK